MAFNIEKYYNNTNNLCYYKYPLDTMNKMLGLNPLSNTSIMIYTKRFNDNTPIAQRNTFDKSSIEGFNQCIKSKKPYSIHKAESCSHDNNQHIYDETGLKFPVVIKTTQEPRFDIDASDYDDSAKLGLFRYTTNQNFKKKYNSIRICDCVKDNDDNSKGKSICKECWYLIGSASITIQYLLEEFYLIKKDQLLWVYSGNRGIHCWINDKDMNNYSNTSFFEDISQPLSLIRDEDIIKELNNPHSKFKELFNNKLHKYFIKYIVNTSLFKKVIPLILEFINCYYNIIYEKIKMIFEDKIYLNIEKWESFVSISTNKIITNWSNNNTNEVLCIPHEFIVMRLLLPIYDKNVNKIGHHLKLPFSIHNTTQRLSFPIEFEKIPDIIMDNEFINKITLNKHICSNKKECEIKDIMSNGILLLETWLNIK
jgi:DNA primase catalytic subunit